MTIERDAPQVLVHVQDHVDSLGRKPIEPLFNSIEIAGVVAPFLGLDSVPEDEETDMIEAPVDGHAAHIRLIDSRHAKGV